MCNANHMELIGDTDGGILMRITGNSRIRILNDIEQKLIDPQYVRIETYKKHACVMVDVGCHKIKREQLCKHKKYYILFTYHRGRPFVHLIWDYNEYTPLYVIYPLHEISDKTKNLYKKFIPLLDNISVDFEERSKNDRIVDDNYRELHYTQQMRPRRKVKAPSMVSIYGKMTKLHIKKLHVHDKRSGESNIDSPETLTDLSEESSGDDVC